VRVLLEVGLCFFFLKLKILTKKLNSSPGHKVTSFN
jgi:hypothetical protein